MDRPCRAVIHLGGQTGPVRTRALATGAVVAAAVALVLAGLAASSSPARHATLRLVTVSPLQVGGAGFRARERVRVVATAAQVSVAKRVRASRRGAFAVTFGFSAGHCAGLRVVATGSAGSRATLKRPPLPACMPQ
jgi:hypothetical protein